MYTILNRKALKLTTIFTKARCFKSFTEEAFNKDLECVPFNVAYIFDDVNDICWAWEKMYTNVLDDHAPIKSKRCRNAAGKSKFIIINRIYNYKQNSYGESATGEHFWIATD